MKRFLQGALHAAFVIGAIVLLMSFLGWVIKKPHADTYEATRFGFYLGCLNEHPNEDRRDLCEMKSLYNYPIVSR